ncbi:hypothetical protein JCM9140_3863 [Halalkalibacter wakoensis JCM 9140]|uniref:Uncharacterized protein n=1 Tax=Halalkalibacter wakoensis JCM 9140 TaxID=1236970 RepID=W4Q6S9_9BACI|nr:polysaccharide biosynthesis protein [Halalkalibacter wakoensis]GAE27707.1 hypothetical protein JCM9140_3863 [Halalkalibacter wakoensis JCM 9140]
MRNNDLLKGVALLSAAALLAKILSAAYRIPYQNMAGDIGYYVYQQIYPLYGIIMTLAMYGFPVALSKHRAELTAIGAYEDAKKVTSFLFYGLLLVAFASWLFIYSFAPAIAKLMGDEQLSGPIQAMSFVLLLLPFLSIGRGYHQGEGQLVPTAVSHVMEQLVRVTLILSFTYYFVRSGYDAYQIGAGAAYGSFFGGIVGFVVLLFVTKAVSLKQLVHPGEFWDINFWRQHSPMFKHSIFICLSALMFVLIQLVDAFTVVRFLQMSGEYPEMTYQIKGIYDRGQPLIQLGTVLTTTLTLALVPLISKAVAEDNVALAKKYQSLSYRLTVLIGGAATVGLAVIIEPTNHMLFTNENGSDVLGVLSFAIIFSSLFVTVSAVLQGYNLSFVPAIAVVIGIGIKLLLNILLIPMFSTMGAAWSTVISIAAMVVYLIYILHKKGHLFMGELVAYGRIGLVMLFMLMVTVVWKSGLTAFSPLEGRMGDAVIAVSSAIVGGLVVMVCLFSFSVFTEDEWKQIPKINKIRERFVKRRRSV